MNTVETINPSVKAASDTTRDRLRSPLFEPLFLCDWVRAAFIHYEVDAGSLQREVPFEIDLFEGRAFVSLVAFSMRRLRPSSGGRLAELAFRPIANHGFLNVRTYVRHSHEAGIYFIAEFLSNPLCVPLGPPTFGLPYRFGRLAYRHNYESGTIEGAVKTMSGARTLTYKATLAATGAFRACQPGTADAFLLERYTAFTRCGNRHRLFRIRHQPWPQTQLEVEVRDEGLLATTGKWIDHARLVGANFSPGIYGVRMGWPRRIQRRERKRRLTAFFDV